MIDVDHQISVVRRMVGSRTLAAGEVRVMTISQSYDTDAADLWDACTARPGRTRDPLVDR